MTYLEFWHWWALALILVVVEALVPSGVFVALAVSAGIMGGLFLYLPDLSWQAQLAGFGGIALVLSYPTTYWYRKKLDSHNNMEEIMSHFIGQDLVLTSAIQNGFGEIELDGRIWSLKGPDIKKGVKVRIVDMDGNMLVVLPYPKKASPDDAME